jgi:hypothetical protein
MLVTVSKEEHGPDGCVGSQRLPSFVQDPLSVSSIILVNDAHTFVSIVVVARAPTWLWPTLADWSQRLRKSPAGTAPSASSGAKVSLMHSVHQRVVHGIGRGVLASSADAIKW